MASGSDDNIGCLFQPDTLLAEQYFEDRRGQSLGPEKRLVLAILEDAILTFQDNHAARDGKKNGYSTKPRYGSSTSAMIGFSASRTSVTYWSSIRDTFAKAWRNGEKKNRRNPLCGKAKRLPQNASLSTIPFTHDPAEVLRAQIRNFGPR